MSSKSLLSQEFLDSILADISVDEQLVFSLNKLLNTIDVVLQSKPSKKLLFIKRDIKSVLRKIKNAVSEKGKADVFDLFKNVYNNVLVSEQSDSVYRVLGQTRSLFQLWANGLQCDKRDDLRIPVSIETSLKFLNTSVDIYVVNISTTGACFFSSKELVLDDEYFMSIQSENILTLSFQPKRVEQTKISETYVQLVGCMFKKPLKVDELRNILVRSFTISENE